MLVSDIQSRVKNLFGDTAGAQITDAMILDWINDGQTDICRKAECLEGVQSQSIVAGTEAYNYPTDFIKEQALKVDGIKLSRLTLPSIDMLYPDRAADTYRGSPLYYFHHNRQFKLYPLPATSGTNNLVVWYIRYATTLTAGGNTPEIPSIYHEDLVRFCLWHALEQDEQWTPAQAAKQDYETRLLTTIADSQVEYSDTYPSVRALPGDCY